MGYNAVIWSKLHPNRSSARDPKPKAFKKHAFTIYARRLVRADTINQRDLDIKWRPKKSVILQRNKRLMRRALDAFENEDYGLCGRLADRVLSKDAGNNFAIALLMRLHFKTGKEEKAARLFAEYGAHANKHCYKAFILGCTHSGKPMWEIAEKAFLDARAKGFADSEIEAEMIYLLSAYAGAIGHSVALGKGEKIFNESSLPPNGGMPRARERLCLCLLRLYRSCCVNGLSEGVVVKAANLLSEMDGVRQKIGPLDRGRMAPKAFVLFLDVLRNAYKWCDKNSILGLAEEAYENAHGLGLATKEVTDAFKFFQERNTEKSGRWPNATAKRFRLQSHAV